MSTFTRRGFLKLAGTGAAVVAASLIVPKWVEGATTYFLPPNGGWRQDRLVIRKLQQYYISRYDAVYGYVSCDELVTRYDATWSNHAGEHQYHIEMPIADDDYARRFLEATMHEKRGRPNSPVMRLALPRGVEMACYI